MTILLGPDERPPVVMLHPAAAGPFLLVCDHAGREVPRRLAGLGVPAAELARHIGWDIGAAGVTRRLAAALDAVAIMQVYSRLVIDCNRAPGHPTSIAPVSDGTVVPGNAGDPPPWRAAREAEIFAPYHDAIAGEIDRRVAAGQPTAVVAVHSFTPVMGGVARIWQAGVLHNHDARLALAVGERLRAEGFLVGDNEPYALGDDSDYTIPVHAERRGLLNLELEIRQDLIAGEEGQAAWAAVLARVLPEALAHVARA
jgi:predicted N-formylglutamate amidohydrolase